MQKTVHYVMPHFYEGFCDADKNIAKAPYSHNLCTVLLRK